MLVPANPQAKAIPVGPAPITTISNITLHNQDEINKKDIRIGDTVLVERAGDVIPKVVKVVKEKRRYNNPAFILPDICPICEEKIQHSKDEVIARSINKFS